MLRTTTGSNGLGQDVANNPDEQATQEDDPSSRRRDKGVPAETHSAEIKPRIPKSRTTQLNGAGRNPQPTLAIFCFEAPDSFIGQYVGNVVRALAEQHTTVHVFARDRFELTHPEIVVHAVGNNPGESYLDQVQEFTRQACNAFLREFPAGSDPITLVGYEWSTIPALSLLHGNRNLRTLLSLHSLERQRGDLSSEISRKIETIELTGLREASAILFHEAKTSEWAKKLLPECGGRLQAARWQFPAHHFATPQLDPGAIKTRYNVGPIDPTILFVGDLDERHGPDVLMKAVPAIVKNHKQARFIFVGDGSLLWPLRVHARYLLLEHVVRLPGHVADQPLYELMQAADIIAVPSREQTEWWPILAGWAACRPVVTTNDMARSLDLQHEKDSVLVYPNPGSFVWGVERLLFDPAFAQTIAQRGRQKLDDRFGWTSAARQIQELMGVSQAR